MSAMSPSRHKAEREVFSMSRMKSTSVIRRYRQRNFESVDAALAFLHVVHNNLDGSNVISVI